MNRLFLIRHGENPANLTLEFSSKKVDYSLTEKGRLQARQTGEWLREVGIDAIYCSPLKRARETAEIIAGILGLEAGTMEAFREVQVGDLEGLPVSRALWDEHDRILLGWMAGNSDLEFPHGDSYHTIWGRMRAGLMQILEGKEGQRIAVVGHGGQFTVTLKDLCPQADWQAAWRMPSGNCSIAEIELDSRDGLVGKLVRWSSMEHLHGEAANLAPGYPKDGTFGQTQTSDS